ncbi:MAG TPA: zinc ribbon domain-containing protein [Gemmatimonadales bacterium]|nr:zinc ribbon domain-containing protein [Gemmatimonadales bacterium]
MLLEAVAAGLVGVALLWLVFEPMLGPPRVSTSRLGELDELEETRKGLALTALKEIEFDRETGKLSDADYAYLKSRYTSAAIEALREEEGKGGGEAVERIVAERVRVVRAAAAGTPAIACPDCGIRPEPDALFCSSCGRRIGGPGACGSCGAGLEAGSRFCTNCGDRIAA